VGRLTLLAIGGPRHGEQLAFREDSSTVLVPVVPDMKAHVAYTRDDQYCVHGSTITSINDGDRHFVSARRVAQLYGLADWQWRPAPLVGHRDNGVCVYPDESGLYARNRLARLASISWQDTTITAAYYEKRIIADRAVLVYRGT
jgi:hypothetical protein